MEINYTPTVKLYRNRTAKIDRNIKIYELVSELLENTSLTFGQIYAKVSEMNPSEFGGALNVKAKYHAHRKKLIDKGVISE